MLFRFTYDGNKLAIESITDIELKNFIRKSEGYYCLPFIFFGSKDLEKMVNIVNFVNENLLSNPQNCKELFYELVYRLSRLFRENDGDLKKILKEIFIFCHKETTIEKNFEKNIFHTFYKCTKISNELFVEV